jgi:hypothetical protein
MKRYTLGMLIHDAKVFNQLRQEYRQAKKKRSARSSSGWLFRYLAGGSRRAGLREIHTNFVIQQ